MAESESGGGSWLLAEEYFERGDPQFLDELRRVVEADRLGQFAARWYNDRRPWAREQLHAYLDLPLNSYRHEALVKRLFKLAEKAGDDATMGRFLVAFDRSIRRRHRKITRNRHEIKPTQAEAQEAARKFQVDHNASVSVYPFGPGNQRKFAVYASWPDEVDITPTGTEMPREVKIQRNEWVIETRQWEKYEGQKWTSALRLSHWLYRQSPLVPAGFRNRLEKYRLFSVATRKHLRRRAWRYFRRLAHSDPARYRAAMVETLSLYRDEDVKDTTALIDNWGLVHILFHNSEALEVGRGFWNIRPGRSLGQLEPSPYRAIVWNDAPRAIFDLLAGSRCRTVRVWATRLARRNLDAVFASATLDEWLDLLTRDDPGLARLVESLIRNVPGLDALPAERWAGLAKSAPESTLPIIADLIARHVRPGTVPIPAAVELAKARSIVLARIGLAWLAGKRPSNRSELEAAWTLLDAEAEVVRPEILRWLREVLQARAKAEPATLAEDLLVFLDSRRTDARAEGWKWFREEPRARGDVQLWQGLLESPYDDISFPLAAELQTRIDDAEAAGKALVLSLPLDANRVRLLWATVLLNIHRGGKTKPGVLRQILGRLEKNPSEAAELLPLVAVALRSTRGPEWRAGLTTVVRLANARPELGDQIAASFPELQIATA